MPLNLDSRHSDSDLSPDRTSTFHLRSVASAGTKRIFAGCAPDQASVSLGSRLNRQLKPAGGVDPRKALSLKSRRVPTSVGSPSSFPRLLREKKVSLRRRWKLVQ